MSKGRSPDWLDVMFASLFSQWQRVDSIPNRRAIDHAGQEIFSSCPAPSAWVGTAPRPRSGTTFFPILPQTSGDRAVRDHRHGHRLGQTHFEPLPRTDSIPNRRVHAGQETHRTASPIQSYSAIPNPVVRRVHAAVQRHTTIFSYHSPGLETELSVITDTDIVAETAKFKDAEKQLLELDEQRAEANAEFKTNLADQQNTVELLEQALTVLGSFYDSVDVKVAEGHTAVALAQQPGEGAGRHPAQPDFFKPTGHQAGGSGVLEMLKGIKVQAEDTMTMR